MRLDILSAVPALLASPLEHSIVGRARAKGLAHIEVHDLHAFSSDKHRKTDDYPYGGGAGMVMTAAPIAAAIRHLQAQRQYDHVVFLTPDGQPLTQALVHRLATAQNLMLLAGHYKGVDQRVRDACITLDVSIGDYVLSGGELPALVLTDALVRLLPGVLGDEESALSDSFQDGLLAPPVYTRPAVWEGRAVPEVLLGGNPRDIDAWRDAQALQKTRDLRPDLLSD